MIPKIKQDESISNIKGHSDVQCDVMMIPKITQA